MDERISRVLEKMKAYIIPELSVLCIKYRIRRSMVQ